MKSQRQAKILEIVTTRDVETQEQLLDALYEKIIPAVNLEDNFLILLGCDAYDVPFKNKNDEDDSDRMEETYRYLLCGICPVKDSKPNLTYDSEEKVFHDGAIRQQLAPLTVVVRESLWAGSWVKVRVSVFVPLPSTV